VESEMAIFLWSIIFVLWFSLAIFLNCTPAMNGFSYYDLKVMSDLLSLFLIVSLLLRYIGFLYTKIKWMIILFCHSVSLLVMFLYTLLLPKRVEKGSFKKFEKYIDDHRKIIR